jgi:alpha-beta hydrolase superfamily lysophospholipase
VLTFVVRHAQKLGLATLGSTDFTRPSKTWKIDDLVNSAAHGGSDAILDPQTKNRADGLIFTRQRVHAGRMLQEYPNGVPDLKPEEAREAKRIAEQVVRRVLDWLDKHPPT